MSRWPTTSQKQGTFSLIDYHPYPAQLAVHASAATLLQIVGAEGAGKSHVTAAELTACVPWSRLIYLVGQTYDNPHKEFEYLVENLHALGALDLADVSQPKQGSWSLTSQTGCHVVTLSVERGVSAVIAKGEEPDIIVLCEAGIINSYSVLLASIRRARRARGRVILVGTLKDDYGWYASLVDEFIPQPNDWRGETYSLPAWTNLYLYPGGRDDPEIRYLEATMPDDEFARTIAAERVPSRALVFPEFSYSVHVRECPFFPALPVHIWIDPGYFPSAYAVLPVQFHGPEVWQIDEIYLNHHTHEQVIEIAQSRPWWARVERAVIDFAGRGHMADRSAEEVWTHKAKIKPQSQQVGVMEGIARHRSFLNPKAPRLFHDPRCTQTLAEYKQYRRRTDRDGNPTSDEPVDRYNHAMKTIAYGLVDRFEFVERAEQIPARVIERIRREAREWN